MIPHPNLEGPLTIPLEHPIPSVWQEIASWARQLSVWEWVGIIWISGLLLFLLHARIRWRLYSGEPMELQYWEGYPGLEGPIDGELRIVGQELQFLDLWNADRIHFRIPLNQIVDASTQYDTLRPLSYLKIGAFALGGERNHLSIRLRSQEGDVPPIRFSAQRFSRAPEVWRQRLKS